MSGNRTHSAGSKTSKHRARTNSSPRSHPNQPTTPDPNEPGEEVEQGQEIGRCGHSGNSSEPHLHFHVHDHAIPYVGAGLPIMFEAATDHPDLEPTDQERTYIHCGQTVTYGDA